MPYQDQTLDNHLSTIRQYLFNAKNTEDLFNLMASRSYTAEKIAEGEQLLETVVQKESEKTVEYGESYSATDRYTAAWVYLTEEFNDLRELGKVAFKNDREGFTTLLLHQKLKRNRPAIEEQIRETLRNISLKPQLLESLLPYGINQETIIALEQGIAEIPSLKMNRADEKKEAQEATRERDKALIILDDWMEDFLSVARIATKKRPELMELLGQTAN